MSNDRKLNYIQHGQVPVKHTGIAHTDDELQRWKRKENNIIYECSICDSKIMPDDTLHTHTQKGKLIERKQPDFLGHEMSPKYPWEILGFICGKCFDESSEYDQLYYG